MGVCVFKCSVYAYAWRIAGRSILSQTSNLAIELPASFVRASAVSRNL